MNNNETFNVQKELQGLSRLPIVKDKTGYVRPSSLSEAVSKNQKTLLDIKKEKGLPSLTGWVIGRVISMLTYLGAYDIASDYQIRTLAARISVKYWYWSVTELDYAFVEFENGSYGKLVHYNHDKNTSVINPQDIMKALQEYEKRMLEERGRQEDEKRKREEARREAEDANKPHGAEAWRLYCEKKGYDPKTHRLQSNKLNVQSVNDVLYNTEEKRSAAERKFEKYRKR